MTEKTTVEGTAYLEGESMIYTISALGAQDANPAAQAIYVTYEAPSCARSLVPEVDMFSGQYVLHSDESDVLTSIFCGDAELGHRDITITNSSSLLGENQTICAFDEGNVTEKQPCKSTSSGTPLVTSSSPLASGCYIVGNEKAEGCLDHGSIDLASSPKEKASTDAKGKSLIFSAIQATLSPEFLAAADDSLRETLQRTASECSLEMVHSLETNLCYVLGWNLLDFLQLEKVVACVLDLSEAVSANVCSKSTNTDDMLRRPATCDKEISCRLLQPQFSRAGREIRCKDYDCYEDSFDIASLRSIPTSKSLTAKENVEMKGKKKRGRPPKALQKIDVNPLLRDDVVVSSENNNLRLHDEKEMEMLEQNVAMTTETSLHNTSNRICSKADKRCEQTLVLPVDQTPEEAMVTKQESVTDEEQVAPDITKFGDSDYDSKEKTETVKQSSLASKDYESRAPFKHCPLCSFRTKRESHLQKHIQLHDRNVPLLHCAHCSFCTTRQNHLTRHEMQHKSTVYHCDDAGCKYRTDNRRLLRRHTTLRHCMVNRMAERQSTMRPALECPMMNCAYKTHRSHLIRRHLTRHTAVDDDGGSLVEQYSCNACPYETKKREHYLRHINVVHSDVRPYLCDNCGQSFKRKDSLAQHSIVHMEKSSRTYQFECQTCHTKFRSQGHLQDHQAKHTSNRLYLCEICGSSFKTKAVQRKHVLSIHSNPRSFTCNICSKGFNTRYALKRHASSHNVKIVGNAIGTEAAVPRETISLGNVSGTVQVAVITGLQSIDPLQDGLVSIRPQLVSMDHARHVHAQVIVRAPQVFALNTNCDQDSEPHFLPQTF